jgi:hypothetical protein
MGRAFRHAAVAACIATLLAPALRADVERAPWSLAARSFALAPGAIDPESLDARAGRAFDASLWSRAGIGLDVDGEFRRAGDGPATRSDLLLDAGLGLRTLESGVLRLDLLTGARIDASALSGVLGAVAAASATAAPMAGARVTLGLSEDAALSLRAAVAPDAEADAAWRISGTLRFGLGDGWALVLDARWSSAVPSDVPGTEAWDGPGRASAWAGFTLPF